MSTSSSEDRNLLAAEYVLGLLRDRAREQFESLLQSDQDMQNQVHDWERDFSPLNETIEPLEPPRGVFARIEQRLFSGNGETAGMAGLIPAWWKGLAIASSMLSFALIAWIALPILDPPKRPIAEDIEDVAAADNYVALFQAEDAEQPVWSVRVDGESRSLLVNAIAVPGIEASQDYQLWLLRDNDQNPLPLGLLPADGLVELDLPDADLNSAQGIAVSLEPKGGSPAEVPTGPVLYVAGLVKAG